MLADVIRLRHNGQKIPADAILKMAPVRGYLELRGGYAQLNTTQNRSPTGGGFHGEALPPLTHAAVRKIEARGMIITGLERLKPLHLNITVPQAWWVRPVLEEPPAG